jgi:hypothetical protein
MRLSRWHERGSRFGLGKRLDWRSYIYTALCAERQEAIDDAIRAQAGEDAHDSAELTADLAFAMRDWPRAEEAYKNGSTRRLRALPPRPRRGGEREQESRRDRLADRAAARRDRVTGGGVHSLEEIEESLDAELRERLRVVAQVGESDGQREQVGLTTPW